MTRAALRDSRPLVVGQRLLGGVRIALTRLVELVRRMDSSMTAVLGCRSCHRSDPPAPGGCC